MTEITPDENTSVLDVGYADIEYSTSFNYIENHYPHLENLIALGIAAPEHFSDTYPEVSVVQYDGNIFPFNDDSFDVCWSNAVVEHVGDRDAQVNFLREIARVSGLAFVTTPNRWFPIEVHTITPLLHYLPKSLFDRYLSLVHKDWARGGFMRLLSKRELRSIMSEAGIRDYKLINNRFMGFTMDFVLIF